MGDKISIMVIFTPNTHLSKLRVDVVEYGITDNGAAYFFSEDGVSKVCITRESVIYFGPPPTKKENKDV